MAKRKKTLVSFLLDETGSMADCLDSTINGFNEYVKNLQRDDEKYAKMFFTLTKFNSRAITTVHNNVPVAGVPMLNRDTYKPGEMTPLYDAIARTIKETESATKKKAVLFIIMTDGSENASKEYSRQQVFDLIQQKEKDGWTFAYLGANQDAWTVASSIGIAQASAAAYAAGDEEETMETLSRATTTFTATGSVQSKSFLRQWTDDDGKLKTEKEN